MELTPEQLQAAETMSMEDLRAAALKEAEVPAATTEVKTEPVKQARGADGKFTTTDDVLDNSADAAAAEAEPETFIVRKEIENGNGSVDVYEGQGATEVEALQDVVEKMAVGKLNANKKIQEFIAERKTADVKNAQVNADDEYVIGEKLKKNPKATVSQIVAEVISEREAKNQRSLDAQEHFVATHPDYIADRVNGNKLAAEVQRIQGFDGEFTVASLEKAYQDLKASGLLKLKPEGAGGATEVNDAATQRTVETVSEATQQRSSRKGSTISARSSSRVSAPAADALPSEDEMNKLPLEEIRRRADAQLAKANAGE